MLTESVVNEIAHLLAGGDLSQRQIAEKLGVSRGIVGQIASGERGLHGKPDGEPPGTLDQAYEKPRASRCRECGCRVHLPCIACSTRRYIALQRLCGDLRHVDRRFGWNLVAGRSAAIPRQGPKVA